MNKIKLKKYLYKVKGSFYAFGPFFAKNKKEAGLIVKKAWNLKTLHETDIWEIKLK